jgi:hypothetical protein
MCFGPGGERARKVVDGLLRRDPTKRLRVGGGGSGSGSVESSGTGGGGLIREWLDEPEKESDWGVES